MPRYWICYDLGLQGNYEELFYWLDKHDARECGESAATFVSKKSRNQIIREVQRVVKPGKRAYLITRHEGGRFVVGKRRAAPWAGYAETEIQSDEVEK